MASSLRECRSCLAAFIVVTGLAGATFGQNTGESPPSNTPKPSVSPAEPRFRERLSGSEYDQRLARALEAIGPIADLEKAPLPPTGMLIRRVEPGSPAERLGMKVGDIVTQIDETRIWSDEIHRTNSPQRLQFYSKSGRTTRTVRIEPGRFGISGRLFWRPDQLYVQGKTKNKKWDREILAGIRARHTDPDLAETAWARAIQSGYARDGLSELMGAEIAMAQQRFPDAVQFAVLARRKAASHPDQVNPLLLYQIAIANHRLREAHAIVTQFPRNFEQSPDELAELIDFDKQLPSRKDDRTPSELAKTMYRDDLINRVTGRNYNSIKTDLPRFQRGEVDAISAGTGKYIVVRFGPDVPTPHFELTVRFTMKQTDASISRYHKEFAVGVLDARDPAYDAQKLLEVGLDALDSARLDFPPLKKLYAYGAPGAIADEKKTHEIRIIRVHGRFEGFLNGTRMLYVPDFLQAPKVDFDITTAGSTVEIRSVKLVELLDRI